MYQLLQRFNEYFGLLIQQWVINRKFDPLMNLQTTKVHVKQTPHVWHQNPEWELVVYLEESHEYHTILAVCFFLKNYDHFKFIIEREIK